MTRRFCVPGPPDAPTSEGKNATSKASDRAESRALLDRQARHIRLAGFDGRGLQNLDAAGVPGPTGPVGADQGEVVQPVAAGLKVNVTEGVNGTEGANATEAGKPPAPAVEANATAADAAPVLKPTAAQEEEEGQVKQVGGHMPRHHLKRSCNGGSMPRHSF